jgi:hypothetical protein
MLVFLLSYLGAFDLIGLGRAALHGLRGKRDAGSCSASKRQATDRGSTP